MGETLILVNWNFTISLESVFGQRNMKTLGFLVFLFLNSVFSEPIWAHGSHISYSQGLAIAIQANFEDGTPMKNAQAVVYSPQDPTTPWLTGMTDEKGQFNFVPDPSLSGNWDVKIRKSGHGDIISIPTEEGKIVSSIEGQPDIPKTKRGEQIVSDVVETGTWNIKTRVARDFTPWQKLMMTVTSVWGFIGTAFFFSRNQKSSTNNYE